MKKALSFKDFFLPLILSVFHCIITLFTDKSVFTVLTNDMTIERWGNYSICKVCLLVLLFYIYRSIIRLIISKDKNSLIEYKILKFAVPYLIPIIAVLIFKLPQGFLTNDESLIFIQAQELNSYKWFYYLTTYYYIVSMMLIPCWFGPVIVKVSIQILICGYVVFRLFNYTNKSKYSFIGYLAFLLPPVLAYTTSAHRIPVFYLLYLLLLFIPLMDKLEGIRPSKNKLFWLLLLSAILTQWRTEGIYIAVIFPLILFSCYKELLVKKNIILLLLFSVMFQYIVAIPQYGLIPDRMGDQANNRMGPFWAYTITNMYRNGLDLEKNAADLDKVGRYLDLSVLDAINKDLGDINYEDTLILYYEGYTGVKPEATVEDYIAYTEGCKNIFINNPSVLIKTKFGSFDYAARPYHLKPGIVNRGKDIVYDLYLPLLLLILIWIYSVIKKNLTIFLSTSGLLGHFIIVFILSPASYFKYYFPIYMMGYFYFIVGVIFYLHSRSKK